MRKGILFIAHTLLAVSLYGQTNLDSIENIWLNEKNADTVRAEALYKLIKLNAEIQNAFSFEKCKALIKFGKYNNLRKYEALGINFSGQYYSNEGLNDSAIHSYNRARVIFEEIGNHRMVAGTYINQGIIYSNKGEMAMAFEHLNLGLDYCLKVNERVFATRAYTALGMLCSRIGELKKGFYYYKKSLELSRKIGDSVGVQYVLNNIAANHEEAGNYKKTHKYINQMLDVSSVTNNSLLIIFGQVNKASVYLKTNKPKLALIHLITADSLSKNTDNEVISIALNNYYGKYFIQNKDWRKALTYCERALMLNKKHSYADQNFEICECLYLSHKNLGNMEQALKFHERVLSIQDIIKEIDIATEIQKAEFNRQITADSIAQLELDRIAFEQQKEIEALKTRKNRIQYSAVIIIVLLLATTLAILTKFKISPRLASGLIFIFFILTFEFLLVVLDPWVDNVSNGEVGWKIAINTAIALILFGIHQVSEKRLKNAILKADR